MIKEIQKDINEVYFLNIHFWNTILNKFPVKDWYVQSNSNWDFRVGRVNSTRLWKGGDCNYEVYAKGLGLLTLILNAHNILFYRTSTYDDRWIIEMQEINLSHTGNFDSCINFLLKNKF
jgi:hypothetical protein